MSDSEAIYVEMTIYSRKETGDRYPQKTNLAHFDIPVGLVDPWPIYQQALAAASRSDAPPLLPEMDPSTGLRRMT